MVATNIGMQAQNDGSWRSSAIQEIISMHKLFNLSDSSEKTKKMPKREEDGSRFFKKKDIKAKRTSHSVAIQKTDKEKPHKGLLSRELKSLLP